MPNYILRKIDPELWTAVKAKATDDGMPLRALLLALLKGYADGRIPVENVRAG